ncbi:MAG: hypothetical protein AAGU05_09700 [Anaerolineaceae bacterium]
MSVELPARDAFFACVHTRFSALNVEPQPVDLELIEVSEVRERARQAVFSLIFLGPADGLLPQHIYNLRHETLGEMDLFLVPVGKGERGFEYQAVFNLLKQAV